MSTTKIAAHCRQIEFSTLERKFNSAAKSGSSEQYVSVSASTPIVSQCFSVVSIGTKCISGGDSENDTFRLWCLNVSFCTFMVVPMQPNFANQGKVDGISNHVHESAKLNFELSDGREYSLLLLGAPGALPKQGCIALPV